jgi:hypothetical protein
VRPRIVVSALSVACLSQPPEVDVHGVANTCVIVQSGARALVRAGDTYAFDRGEGTPVFLRPSDLATYLLHDPDGGYVVRDGDDLVRQTTLESDISRYEDGYVSGAEWLLEVGPDGARLRNKQDDASFLALDGLTFEASEAAPVAFLPATGCAEPPELSVDATGVPERTRFEDGDLYGIVDAHSHLFSNFGFGGGLYHGSPFHPLGVEHALPDCSVHHGEKGRRDFFGYTSDNPELELTALLAGLTTGEVGEDAHETGGYPDFPAWPDANRYSTHQTQYYRWLERAWLAGLRLVVQDATSNSVICDISVGLGATVPRYACDDMTGVDRQIDAVYALERYVDAQHGGPGQGWFRVVTTPAQAREVIGAGKLAVVLGIETSNLFDCYLTPKVDSPVCDEAHVRAELDRYHAAGVRVLFPGHKFDNAFTAGDGDGSFIEVGNVLNTGHYANFTQDCPGVSANYDHGGVDFPGLLQAREVFDAPPPLDFTGLDETPLDLLAPYFADFLVPPLDGEWCQNHGFTELGETLLREMMLRGMIVEVDHMPQRTLQRAFEMLDEAAYPAIGSHWNDHRGRLYEHGGISPLRLPRCQDPDEPGASWAEYRARLDRMREAGQYPSIGAAFDFNGFATAPRPRFGERAACSAPQADPVTYPFTSWDGAVTFTEPRAGNRVFDFNTEGMLHIGLFPELVEDIRKDGTDADLEALFRSAEGYLRFWERSEAAGRALAER